MPPKEPRVQNRKLFGSGQLPQQPSHVYIFAMDHLPTSIKCPNCASAIKESDYDQEKGTIRCGYCGTLMLPPKAQGSGFRQRPPIALPEKMTLEKTMRGLVITRRWMHVGAIFLIPFCIVWDSFLVGIITATSSPGVPWFVRLFPLAHVCVGVGLTYYTLALLLNRTRIIVTHGSVTVSHGPLPWTGWREIMAGQIDQLFCKEILRHTKQGVSTHYEVWVTLVDGTQSKLVGVGINAEQALYIEQQIEIMLDLKDRAMSGEVRR